MPKISVPKDSLKGLPALPPGIYDFRVDSFEPKKSKKGDSVNLNPILKIINHPQLNDRQIFENMNSQAGWIQNDFLHSLGLTMESQGDDASLPGTFTGPDDDPTKWSYTGPIVGAVGRCEVIEVDNQKGGKRQAVKRYFCKVSGCTEKHSESLNS